MMLTKLRTTIVNWRAFLCRRLCGRNYVSDDIAVLLGLFLLERRVKKALNGEYQLTQEDRETLDAVCQALSELEDEA